MDIRQLQALIDKADSAEEMVTVGRAYMNGYPLSDPVAAEAWLLRAVALEDPVWSVRAMGFLAKLLGQAEVLSDEDLSEILSELPTAQGQHRVTLLELLKLSSKRQKNEYPYEKSLQS